MAEAQISPGVFTNVKDRTFLAQGIASIGAAIVGPTPKGPAFVPTILTNWEDYKALFGGTTDDTYIPHAVRSYIQSAASVTVVRVVQEGGYVASPLILTSGSYVLSVLGLTTTVGQSSASLASVAFQAISSVSSSFSASVVIAGNSSSFTGSLLPTQPNALSNIFGTGIKSTKDLYSYIWAGDYIARNSSSISSFTVDSTTPLNFSGSYGAIRAAATPWITSQFQQGTTATNLFRIHALADGDLNNTALKISIVNTALPGQVAGTDYGTFNLLVREHGDTDQRPVVLETFTNLTLDPTSPNYIARRIGDKHSSATAEGLITSTGDYDGTSKYVRVTVHADIASQAMTPTVYPHGFAALMNPLPGSLLLVPPVLVTNSGSGVVNYINATLNNTEINGSYTKKAFYGWSYNTDDNDNFLKAIPSASIAHPSASFNLSNCYIHPDNTATATNSVFAASRIISASVFTGADVSNVLRFSVPLQDGCDGMDPAIPKNVGADITAANVMGLDCTFVASSGSVGYIKALNVLSNKDQYDINLIAMPGLNAEMHLPILEKAIEVAEDRGDVFVTIDPTKLATDNGLSDAIAAIANGNFDTNTSAAYWPWVKIKDVDRNKFIWVPGSACTPQVFAQSDILGHEWLAPSGLNRGGIAGAVSAEYKLTQAQRGELYQARINAIADFPGQGVVIWGQKTLQALPSALDRVNVSRLLIALKKYIASTSRYLVFENNTTQTRARFVNLVTPYLETVKAQQGLYAFKVVMDESNNPASTIDALEMKGDIFLQPAKAAEFIKLDFNVMPTGASFGNV